MTWGRGSILCVRKTPTDTTAPGWEGNLRCRLHTWIASGYLTTASAPGCAPVPKDYVPRGPALTSECCTPLTPPGNPSLPSSGPSDSRLLPNHGDQPRTYQPGLAPRRFGKEMRFSARGRALLPSLGICKMAPSPEIVGGRTQIQRLS